MNRTPPLANELMQIALAVDNPAAFAILYNYYFPRVYNYIRYRVHDPTLTDDLTASVFERALANLSTYRPERAPFAAWLFSIARHVVADHFRKRRRRQWLSLDVLRDHATTEPDPEQVTADNSVRARLLDAVAALDAREQDLIALKFAAGFTNRQIAQLTGLSESNVGVIIYRTVHRLRDMLQDILPRYEE